MKKILFLLLFIYSSKIIAQNYVNMDDEPFRRADMIIITVDSTDKDVFTEVGKVLVSNNYSIKEAFREFGSITTNYGNTRFVQLKLEILIIEKQIRIHGKYRSQIVLGNDATLTVLGGKDLAQKEDVLLDYRNDLKDYYNLMTIIASEIKNVLNANKLVHVERAFIEK